MKEQKIYSPKIIPYRKGDKWGYVDREKKVVIGLKYDQCFPFIGEIAKVILKGKCGLILADGTELLAPIYNEIADIDTGALLDEYGACLVHGNANYGLVSCWGEVLASVSFPTVEEAYEQARSTGWNGSVPKDGLPQMPLKIIKSLDQIGAFQSGIAPFKRANLWGLISNTGEEICLPLYDEIEFLEDQQWSCRKDDKWGLLDSKGSVIISPKYEDVRVFSNGQAGVKEMGLWGTVDKKGNWIFPPQFQELGLFKEGLSAAQKNDLFGFINEKGETIIDFQFQDVYDFHDGACLVFEGSEYIYFIDKTGEKISEQFLRMMGPNQNGLTHVYEGEKWGLMNPSGKFILDMEYDILKAMGQNLAIKNGDFIPIKKGPFLGVVNNKGEEIAPPVYTIIGFLTENLSLVSIPDPMFDQELEKIEASGIISGCFLFGFINAKGEEVIKPKYTLAHDFENGLAFVDLLEDGVGYITPDGIEYFEN